MNKHQLAVLSAGMAVGICSGILVYGLQPMTIAGGDPAVLLEGRRWDSPYILVDESVVALFTIAIIFSCRKRS